MDKGSRNLIYLTGFMGSGKSTLGPILANTLGLSFVDIDKEIIRVVGKPITGIFLDFGEKYFREIEHSLLQEISTQVQTVISLGGGSVAFERNMKIIQSTGTLVYLRTDEEQLFKRLSRKSDRPLLRSTGGIMPEADNLRQSIRSLIATREKFYMQADITILTSGRPVGITIDEIVTKLKPYLNL
jgi:shikimate kinase